MSLRGHAYRKFKKYSEGQRVDENKMQEVMDLVVSPGTQETEEKKEMEEEMQISPKSQEIVDKTIAGLENSTDGELEEFTKIYTIILSWAVTEIRKRQLEEIKPIDMWDKIRELM